MSKACYVVAAWLFIMHSQPGAGKPRLELPVGEVESLEFDEPVQVQISRKGIVHADTSDGRRWTLTALRSGIVVVSFVSRLGETVQSYVVEVSPKESRRKLMQKGRFPDDLCHFTGVVCVREEGVISGLVDSYHWQQYARQRCRHSGVCRFDVRLSDEGQAELAAVVHEMLASHDVDVKLHPSGQVSLLMACYDEPGKEKAAAIRQSLALIGIDDQLQLDCRNHGSYRNFWLQFYVLQSDSANSEERKLHEFNARQARNSLPQARDELINSLKFIDQKTTLMATPSIMIAVGEKVQAKSGSELRIDGRTQEGAEYVQWKPLGLDIEAGLSERGGDLRLDVGVRLSGHTSRSGHISQHHLSSKFIIELDRPVLVGTINLDNHLETNLGVQWFSDLPIIGPLFRDKSTQKSTSKLYLMVELTSEMSTNDKASTRIQYEDVATVDAGTKEPLLGHARVFEDMVKR